MKILEKICLISAVISVLMKAMGYPGGSFLLVLSLTLLSLIYLTGLFFILVDKVNIPLNDENNTFEDSNLTIGLEELKKVYKPVEIVISILGGLAFSISLFGVLFSLQKYPGATLMLLSGMLFTFMVSTYTVFSFLKWRDTFSERFLKRGGVLLLIMSFLLFVK